MIGFKVEYNWYEIGSSDFLYAFFSTVAYNLENKKWGIRFPIIMKRLYLGKLETTDISSAIIELKMIQQGLWKFKPDKIIWDYENPKKQPPWGKNISPDIIDLANYFVTSDGEDFLTIFLHALEKAKELNSAIEIQSL